MHGCIQYKDMGIIFSIILESAYSLHDRVFFDNIGTILWYAVMVNIRPSLNLSTIGMRVRVLRILYYKQSLCKAGIMSS